ncbi:HEPN domain-containing protein [Geothrix paludis]|uniref:HEPN domain-containing protein n=1 Tax=Geothrix paludis TaxID=2922722 RepID=UPI001FADFD6C|nr:HEPN domain-containing protein [Geothrix paludis]
MPPRNLGRTEDWLARAEASLALARMVGPGVALEDLCFQVQQAAEKALKAVFIHRKTSFPFVHDLDLLFEGLEELGYNIPEPVDAASILTRYASETRYPGGFEPLTREDHARALELAEVVLAWAKVQCGLGDPGPRS